MKPILSKSTFMRAMQCLKSLYLYKNQIYLKDKIQPELQAIFDRGNLVGKLARNIFPGGVLISSDYKDTLKSVNETKQAISSGVSVIYEAAFEHEGVFCALDILVKKEDGWYAYEVKSSAKITPTYVLDAALQYWIINRSGVELHDISIINLNTNYVREGELDLEKLFNKTSITDQVLKKQDIIEEKVREAKQVLTSQQMPEIEIGEHCFAPYKCDFKSFCWRYIPKESVFNVAGLSRADQFELYNKGIISMADVPSEMINSKSSVQVDSASSNQPVIEKQKIKEFLNGLVFPLLCIDFETTMPAIPRYNGVKPFQPIPFQYSIHKINSVSDPAALHFSFLAEPGYDERLQFLQKFIKDTEGEGAILTYAAGLEREVLNKLAQDYPEFSEPIKNRLERIKDLLTVFEKRWFYFPSMKGSNSIKNVLAAIEPQANYSQLKINSGTLAMTAYENLIWEKDMFKAMETREALLEYCKLDTLAMVKILCALEKAVA